MRSVASGRSLLSGIALTALLLFAACGPSSASPPAPAHTLTLTRYHVALHIAAGWIVLDQHEDGSATTPLTLTVERAHVSPDHANSDFNFQVVLTNSPNLAPFLAGLPKDPTYQTIHLNGQVAYVSPPQILATEPPPMTPGATPGPPQTPIAGAPGTLTHIDFVLVTPTYSYMWYTEAVAGDNADTDLDAMSQSIHVLP